MSGAGQDRAGTAASLPDRVVSIHINAPVDRVWAEITKVGAVQRALFDTVLECELRPGSRLRYCSRDRKRVFVVGEVVEVDPPRRFVHTYRFTTWKTDTATLVAWELADEAGGCRVTVTHSGWTTDHGKLVEETDKGWRGILEVLKHEMETGRIPLKTRLAYRVMHSLSFMLLRSTRTSYQDRRGSG